MVKEFLVFRVLRVIRILVVFLIIFGGIVIAVFVVFVRRRGLECSECKKLFSIEILL